MSAAHLRGPAVWVRDTPGCSRKIQYSTRKEAATQAKKIGRGRPYHCVKCGRWHLTTGRALPEGVRADG